MSRGTWDDFTSKWGFNDGTSTEARDYAARDTLCRLLNRRADVKAAKIRVVPYDRPGVHNGCLIIILENIPGLSTAHLLHKWARHELKHATRFPPLEEGTDTLDELIDTAYDLVDQQGKS